MAYHSLWKMIPRPAIVINRFYAAMAARTKQTKLADQEDSVAFSGNVPKEEFDVEKAMRILKAYSLSRIDETLELSIKLNIMEKKDKRRDVSSIRGTIYLPRNYFKDRTVIVFAEGRDVETAKNCGASEVGMDDIIEKIQSKSIKLHKKKMRFLTTKSNAKKIRSLQSILRAKLMPNKRKGSMVDELTPESVNRLKKGIEYKADKNGIINVAIGRLSFPVNDVKQNIDNVLNNVMTHKGKGRFIIQKVLSSTRGPGVLLK